VSTVNCMVVMVQCLIPVECVLVTERVAHQIGVLVTKVILVRNATFILVSELYSTHLMFVR